MSNDNPQPPSLSVLLAGIKPVAKAQDTLVTGLAIDSRKVKPGDCFFAYPGTLSDGRQYIAQALANGARCVLYEPHPDVAPDARCLPLANVQQHIGTLAARFWQDALAEVTCIGITGTNGKSTSVYWLSHCLERAGISCAMIGTIGSGPINHLQPATLTTPDPITLHEQLAGFAKRGIKTVAMEVSSHSLCQHRVVGVPFHYAGFTNLSHEHLDYHGTLREYAAAKARLFDFSSLKAAVINADDAVGADWLRTWAKPYPLHAVSSMSKVALPHVSDTFYAHTVQTQTDWHIQATLSSRQGEAVCRLPIVGRFNLDNALLVAKLLDCVGMAWGDIIEALHTLPTVPGRMQVIANHQVADCIVDYAHTPDALTQVLKAARTQCKGRLISVFGCGGERDAAKRALMGQVAGEAADSIILTNDNPRGESEAAILDAIKQGIPAHARVCTQVVPARELAIATAVASSHPDDVIVIAGKGHETSQQLGNKKIAFNDSDAVKTMQARAQHQLLTVADYARMTAGRVHHGDAQSAITGISIDTRTLAPGQGYVAIIGEHCDGHDFIQQAIEAGARCIIANDSFRPSTCPIPIIHVRDTTRALADIGRAHRAAFTQPVIGITGSCGKTTVKEMLGCILRECGQVLCPQRSFNNHIGVPLTLSQLTPNRDYAVIEMGTNHPGEIAALATLAQPTIAVVNNVGPAHLEGLKSIEGVAEEKGALYAALQAQRGDVAVINLDDAFASTFLARAMSLHRVTYSHRQSADVMAIDCDYQHTGCAHFTLATGDERVRIELTLPGEHQLANALAAASCAIAAGVSLAQIKTGLTQLQPVSGRWCEQPGIKGAIVVDDSYNANPKSVCAAIRCLAKVSTEKWFVLGDMGELGESAVTEHQRIGKVAMQCGINRLLTVGSLAQHASRHFSGCGEHFADNAALIDYLKASLTQDVTVVVKGSRSAKMETIVHALVKEDH